MALETSSLVIPTHTKTRHDIQVGSQKFTLVDQNKDGVFEAGTDKVLQEKTAQQLALDGKKFLEKFGLNPKVPLQITGLVAYFNKLNSLPDYPLSAASYSFHWTKDVCQNSLVEICLPQTDEQRIVALFSSPAEQEATGLRYAQKAGELLTNYGKANMADKYKLGEALLHEAQNQLDAAKSLLGKSHPQVKALQDDCTSKLDTQKRVYDIVQNRVQQLVIGHLSQVGDGIYDFFADAKEGKLEYSKAVAEYYKDRILKHEAAKRAGFQELAANLAAFQRDFGDVETDRLQYVIEMVNNPAVRQAVTIVSDDGEVIATLEPLLAE